MMFRGVLNFDHKRCRYDVLQPIIVPMFQSHPHLRVFQHDNARPHAARASMYILATNIVFPRI